MFRHTSLIALCLVAAYDLLMELVKPDGMSLGKVAITLLPWLAVAMTAHYCLSRFRSIRAEIPPPAQLLLLLLLAVNLVNIGRALIGEGTNLSTMFGNRYNALALLTPFAAGLGVVSVNLAAMQKLLLRLVQLGIPLILMLLLIQGLPQDRGTLSTVFEMLYPAVFLVGSLPYLKIHAKVLVVAANLMVLVFPGFIVGSRATILRICLLFGAQGLNKTKLVLRKKVLLVLFMAVIVAPILFIPTSGAQMSIFQRSAEFLQSLTGSVSNAGTVFTKSDTRTFLYTEVLADLGYNSQLLFGKGAAGTYFSQYFLSTRHDTDTRLTVEVGALAYLLKGGLLALVLNLAVFYFAIFLALFRSNNDYVKWLGMMLLVHVALLFAENLVAFNMYNFFTWFFVGVCCSNTIRRMDDRAIRLLLGSNRQLRRKIGGIHA